MWYFMGQPVSGWLVTEYLSKEGIFGQENWYCLCQKIQTAFSPFINHTFILRNNFPKRAVGIYYSLKDQTNPPNPKSKQNHKPAVSCWYILNPSFQCAGHSLFWYLLLLPASSFTCSQDVTSTSHTQIYFLTMNMFYFFFRHCFSLSFGNAFLSTFPNTVF